jgi:hypothetical protein
MPPSAIRARFDGGLFLSWKYRLVLQIMLRVVVAKPSTDASQRKKEKMYEDNLAELLEHCAENENFCLFCYRTRTDVVVRHNCCQECDMV